ncbi:MAG: protein kinase, partial [Acidobacteriota bacterium]
MSAGADADTDWAAVDRWFDRALERPEDDRRRFLERECPRDDVRATVLELLAALPDGQDRFEVAVARAVEWLEEDRGGVEENDAEDDLPDLGPYRAVERIGQGGVGSVYRAEKSADGLQLEFAVKLVRPELAGGEMHRRLRQERQILAGLEHPNIARLTDGGANRSGRPYLVMELIVGRAIDVYCEEQRLRLSERLRLFLRVCDAVSFAHRSLVIHRDIKPSNILVTENGEP